MENKKYEGDCKNNKAEGKGILYHENRKKRYEGDLKNNKAEGKGILYDENENKKYEGEFKKDKFEGKGILYDDWLVVWVCLLLLYMHMNNSVHMM